jgi:hypothetical protein
MSTFANPAPSAGSIDWNDLNGRLLIFDVTGQEIGIKTSNGTKDPVRADLVVLDGDTAGEKFDDTLVFPTVLISQLKPRIGQKVLGRLGQGIAKPGQSAPWILQDATAEEIAVAEKWVAENTTPAVSSAKAPF